MNATLVVKAKPEGFFHNIEHRELYLKNTIRNSDKEKTELAYSSYRELFNNVADLLMVNTDNKD